MGRQCCRDCIRGQSCSSTTAGGTAACPPSSWYCCSSAPMAGLFSSLTKQKTPDSQKQMVLYWISGLNQPRVQRAPHDGLWERDSSNPTLLRPLSPSHQHKQPHSLPSLATDPALGAIHSSPWAVFCLDPILCLNACGRVG